MGGERLVTFGRSPWLEKVSQSRSTALHEHVQVLLPHLGFSDVKGNKQLRPRLAGPLSPSPSLVIQQSLAEIIILFILVLPK